MKGPDDEDEGDDGVTQRRVSACDASPLFTPAASSVFNWRPNGAAAPCAEPEPDAGADGDGDGESTPPPPPREQEKPVMVRRTVNKAPRTGSGSPQMQICSVLLQNGDLTNEQLGEALPQFDIKQVKYAITNALSSKRVTKKAGERYHLTAAGKAWVEAAAGEETPPAAPTETVARERKSSVRQQRTARPAEPALDTPTTGQQPSFRCAVMSDGAFFIRKGDTHIELDAAEHAQMLHYLERMAEAAP